MPFHSVFREKLSPKECWENKWDEWEWVYSNHCMGDPFSNFSKDTMLFDTEWIMHIRLTMVAFVWNDDLPWSGRKWCFYCYILHLLDLIGCRCFKCSISHRRKSLNIYLVSEFLWEDVLSMFKNGAYTYAQYEGVEKSRSHV